MVEGLGLQKMLLKASAPSRALVIKINLFFLAFFLFVYAALLLRPSLSAYHRNAASLVGCTLRECHPKVENGVNKMVVSMENMNKTKTEIPTFLNGLMQKGMKIGMVNMEEEDLSEWNLHVDTIPIHFEQVSNYFEWKHLFPEWIDEEEDSNVPLCPEIPMPDFRIYEKNMDMLVAKLPCKYPEEGWARDVFRLQVHLVAVNLAAQRGKRDQNLRTKVVFLSKCRPMLEVFRCEDLVRNEGDWWFYEPEMGRLEQKVKMPIGSCQLALPLWGKGIDEVYDVSKLLTTTLPPKREAYATVLHSSDAYVCGAIALAQSLLHSGTKRHLLLLLDYNSISAAKRYALVAAGWQIRPIERIRNPRAQKNTYNEYNYSKFRLWQLTDYDKIVFIDADIIVLRNLDHLFHFPQVSATGNDVSIFNSGIMVIEPSKCTFQILMDRRKEIVSYNGGDQGFLNEIFVWWHRLPRRVNFLKNFWANTTGEAAMKNQLFAAEPPKLYSIHYLGLKPWLCYRDYDCNWDVENQHVYASDAAHRRWWKFHDAMDEKLQKFCGLTKKRRIQLDWNRKVAREKGLEDAHWRINITDPRRVNLI